MTMISAPEMIATPVAIRLIRRDCVDHARSPVCVAECNLHNWKPYSDKLDWGTLYGCDDWHVVVVYDNGREYAMISARTDGDDHTAIYIASDGKVKMRFVSVGQIIPTVRLFLSAQVIRGNLKIGYKNFEQLGEQVTAYPPIMFIRRRIDCDK